MTESLILDSSKNGRSYFGIVPHMAGAKLDVYEHRLYCHYIEVCGLSPWDKCTQAERTIYRACEMSKQRFHKARKGLIDKKFITFRPGKANKKGQKGYSALTTIPDIWEENIQFCKARPYTGQILPLEGVNNDPLKGSDITRNKKYKNLEKEKDFAGKPQAATKSSDGAVAGDGGDHSENPDDWVRTEWKPEHGEIICCGCEGVIRRMPGAKIAEFYCLNGYIAMKPLCPGCWNEKLDSKNTPPALTDEQAAVLELICRYPGTIAQIKSRANLLSLNEFRYITFGTFHNEDWDSDWAEATPAGRAALEAWQESCDSQPIVTITADDDIAPETMEALGGMIVAADKAIKAGTLGKKTKAKKPRKTRKPKKEVHPFYQEMTQAIKDAFKVNDEHADKSDFSRIGKVANNLLDRGAKPFMIGRFYEWCRKEFDSKTLNYEILTKWYTRWRSEMGDRIPDELPQAAPVKVEEVAPPPVNGKEVTAEDCRRATAELAEKMSMSQFDDENYED